MKTRAGPTGPARGALAGMNYEPAMGLTAACGVWMTDDFAWAGSESSGGGGAVDSVNGQTGTVVLDADDVGALEAADIGVSVQGYDALLASIAGLSMVADRYIYGTGTDAVALGTITSFARSILDDADAATVRATIGAGTGSGDVVGPSSATDNALARYDGTTGKLIQSSGVILSDGDLLSGVEGLALDQRAASPGSGYLWTSDGTTYTAGTLVWGDAAQVLGELGVGDPGSEQASILLNGSTYTAPFKVNAFGTSRAGAVLHQHSNTVEPDLVFARSRGTTSSHSQVTDTTILGRLIWAGWIDGTTGYARGAEVRAVIDGTPSASSAPTRLDFATTPSGSLTPTDRWSILPNGTLRPAADAAYQLGNVTYAALDVWSLQYSGKEQASVQAPSGGWTGRWAFWGKTGSPSEPMYTDDGGTDRRLIHRDDVATTSAAGVAEVATYLEGQSTTSLRVEDATKPHNMYRPGFAGWGAMTASPVNDNANGDGTLAVVGSAGSFIGVMDATAGALIRFATSTTIGRGAYAGDGAGGLTWATAGYYRYVFRFGGSSTFRIYGGLNVWTSSANIVAAESSTAATIRFGNDAGTIRAICADGSARTKVDFTTSPGATTIYEWEIIINRAATSVEFNLYSYSMTGGRGSLLETGTITTNIPTGATVINPAVWTLATSGTPNAWWHSIEIVGNTV
jgi:hypothetical protein